MDPEILAAHAGFLRSLARELLADASLADDVLQAAWLAAAQRPPRDPGRIRAWLAVVVQNLARKELREEARRRRRERRFAPPEDLPAAEWAVEKGEMVRVVAEAVTQLDELYRTVILLRFYENRKTAAIAHELGVPVETVRTRLKRALALLRERLEVKTGGDRRSLGLALIAAFRPDPPASLLIAGVLAMGTAAKLLVSAGVLLVLSVPVVLATWSGGGNGAEPQDRLPSIAGAPGVAGAEHTESTRVAVPAADEVPAPVAGTAADFVARGTVHDDLGKPVAGAMVRVSLNFEPLDYPSWDPVLAEGRTDAAGRFDIDFGAAATSASPYVRDRYEVRVLATAAGLLPALETVRSSLAASAEQWEPGLVLQPEPKVVRGRVVDTAGRPVAGAAVGLLAPGETDELLGGPRTGEDGTFAIPVYTGIFDVIAVALDRGVGRTGPVDLDDRFDATVPDIRIVEGGVLEGEVVAPDGSKVADLEVTAAPGGFKDLVVYFPRHHGFDGLREGSTRTDKQGRFRFAGLLPGEYHLLPRSCHSMEGNERPFATGSTDIRLVVERYRLHVHVRDELGQPLDGADLMYRSPPDNPGGAHSPGPGHVALQAFPGRTFIVAAHIPGRRSAEASVDVPEGRYESSLTLTLAPLFDAPGSIRIRIEDQDGQGVPCAAARLATPLTGLRLRSDRRDLGDGETLLETVPPGRYVLSVAPGESLIPGDPDVTLFSRIRREVEVGSGEETVVVLTGTSGARVRFTIHAPVGDDAESLTGWQVTAQRGGGAPERMRAFITQFPDGDWQKAGPFHPGLPALSNDLYEPSSYIFRFRFSGYLPVETTALLKPGEVTDVDVFLTREQP